MPSFRWMSRSRPVTGGQLNGTFNQAPIFAYGVYPLGNGGHWILGVPISLP
jgi:hypothetical protein